MPIVKYAPFADTEDFPTGLRLFQDSINRLFSEDGVKTRPWAPAVDILESGVTDRSSVTSPSRIRWMQSTSRRPTKPEC
jgi:hypothetical protein